MKFSVSVRAIALVSSLVLVGCGGGGGGASGGGGGTTAQAVLELNAQDGGNRKFILVQLPEPTERKDFPTIADITKERVRRVIKKLEAEIVAKELKERKE